MKNTPPARRSSTAEDSKVLKAAFKNRPLIGIGLIFNLDQKTTETMYAELAERRANGTAEEA